MSKYTYLIIITTFFYSFNVFAEDAELQKLSKVSATLQNSFWGAVVRADLCIKDNPELSSYKTVVDSYKKDNEPVLNQSLAKQKAHFNAEEGTETSKTLDKGFILIARQMIAFNQQFMVSLQKQPKEKRDKFCKEWLELIKSEKLHLKNRNPEEYLYVYQ